MLLHILQISFILSVISMARAEHPNMFIEAITKGGAQPSNFKKVGDKLYLFVEQKVSWYSALLQCRDNGGTLASIESAAELNALSNYLIAKNGTQHDWWLSASNVHMPRKGDFTWYGTGKPMNFSKWIPGTPSDLRYDPYFVQLSPVQDGKTYQMSVRGSDWVTEYICESRKSVASIRILF